MTDHRHHDGSKSANRRNVRIAAICTLVVVGMVGMSYAAVPLYTLFCQVTGYGGTTQRAEAGPASASDQTIRVRFDANVAPGLAWRFEPVQREVEVRLGEQKIAYYRAVNTTDRPLTGTATFNVTPMAAGIYFNKIQCFCFTEQTLGPGESVEMPVLFFVDPEFAADADTKGIHTLTLSYTFFPRQGGVSESSVGRANGREG